MIDQVAWVLSVILVFGGTIGFTASMAWGMWRLFTERKLKK